MTKRVLSKDHRFVFSNSFQLKVSDNDIAVTFCNQHAFGDDGEVSYFDEVTVMLTPRSLKVLSLVLKNATDDFERDIGPIPLPAGKEEKLAADFKKKKKLINPEA